MFTGIIEHIGLIIAISGPEITIGDAAPVLGDAKVGDQMGVNGELSSNGLNESN
jgi:riboflavin synthase alpha subunit